MYVVKIVFTDAHGSTTNFVFLSRPVKLSRPLVQVDIKNNPMTFFFLKKFVSVVFNDMQVN